MEELLKALADSLAHAGPAYVLSFGALVLFVAKIWPTLSDMITRREDREDRKEQREAETEKARIEHDKEMAELNGKWLITSEQSARAMEAIEEQMRVLDATLKDSKDRSRDMARKVDEIHAATVSHMTKEGK